MEDENNSRDNFSVPPPSQHPIFRGNRTSVLHNSTRTSRGGFGGSRGAYARRPPTTSWQNATAINMLPSAQNSSSIGNAISGGSVVKLEECFNLTNKEKEDLEEKINIAVNLQKELSELESSDNFLSEVDKEKIRQETSTKEIRLAKSLALNQKIKNVDDYMKRMKSSNELLNPDQTDMIKKRIQLKTEKIEKAVAAHKEISIIESSPGFVKPLEIENLKQKLVEIESVFQKIQGQNPKATINKAALSEEGVNAILQVHEEAREELECVICLVVPNPEDNVFSCLQHHLLCSDCVKRNLQSCPVCRQSFQQTPPARNRLAEKMIQRLK